MKDIYTIYGTGGYAREVMPLLRKNENYLRFYFCVLFVCIAFDDRLFDMFITPIKNKQRTTAMNIIYIRKSVTILI